MKKCRDYVLPGFAFLFMFLVVTFEEQVVLVLRFQFINFFSCGSYFLCLKKPLPDSRSKRYSCMYEAL